MRNIEKLIQHVNNINLLVKEPLITLEPNYDREKLIDLLPSPLPDDFVEFFTCIGNSQPSVFSLVESTRKDDFVQKFFSEAVFELFNPIEGSLGIQDCLECYEERMPTWLISFAPDYMANNFVLSIRESDYGSVYLWLSDYEYVDEEDGQLDDYVDNLIHLADSFSEFILKMKVNEDYLE
jgi:hypothetical protein